MERVHQINPFTKRDSHDKRSLLAYRILSIVTWLLVVITTIYYTFHAPDDGQYHRRKIWGQNSRFRTPFSLNKVITNIYWIVLWILQGGYVWHLFSSDAALVTAAANVGSHFILSNLLQFAWVMLWVRTHLWIAELMLVLNFINLTFLYFWHPTTPRFIHIPVVSGPLAWTFVALFWNGAAMVHAHSLAARIIANIAIWSWLFYGLFFLVVFKDYTIGFALSVLTASLGVAQFGTRVVALQWIFAFTIMAVLFLFTVVIAVPGVLGRGDAARDEVAGQHTDRERAPLLADA